MVSLSLAAPASADTPGPVAPAISALGSSSDDAGFLEFHAASDTPIDPASVTAQLTLRVSGERPVTTVDTGFELVSGTPTDGTWRTTTRLSLAAHGWYDATLDLADADGDHPAYPAHGEINYNDWPVFTDTRADRSTVDYEQRWVTVSGTVSTFDPATGLTTPGWKAGSLYLSSLQNNAQETRVPSVAADGSYSVTSKLYGTLSVGAMNGSMGTTNSPFVQVDRVYVPTRVVVEKASATIVRGNSFTLRGKAQYLSPTTNQWTGLIADDPDTGIAVSSPDHFQVIRPTAPDGSFSLTTPDVQNEGEWSASIGGYGFLLQAYAGTQVHVLSRSVLSWTDRTISGAGTVRVKGSLTAAPGPCPQGKVQVQQSPDGSTGWSTIATVTPNSTGAFDATATIPAAKRNGYLRLYYPGSADATATARYFIPVSRTATRITAFNASPEPVRKGQLITVAGTLQANQGKTWAGLSGQTVHVWFTVPGSKTPTLMSTVKTGKGGTFSKKFTALRDGTWTTTWTATSQYFDTSSSGDYVDVR
ncbi:hypothetical protein [Streptomyces sp. NPDC005281]|uniref:hypothetical protein n=1 Tax=Streptomyces sp. NPDC005281 TaxID=3155712 RepID=UPI0033B4217D